MKYTLTQTLTAIVLVAAAMTATGTIVNKWDDLNLPRVVFIKELQAVETQVAGVDQHSKNTYRILMYMQLKQAVSENAKYKAQIAANPTNEELRQKKAISDLQIQELKRQLGIKNE